MDERTCSEPGCSKPHRARGLCSTHYNQQRQPNRHRKVTMACDYCGEPCEKYATARYAGRFCSLLCRDLWRIATDTNPRPSQPYKTPPRKSSETQAPQVLAVCPITFGPCVTCATPISHRFGRRYCKPCAAARKYARRSSRWTRRRLAIFQRDQYVCWLCGGKCDPDLRPPHLLAPTIDHVVPRNHGGTDDDDNLACAHLTCNSQRGDSLTRLSTISGLA